MGSILAEENELFLFYHSDDKTKLGVELCYSTHNVSIIDWKVQLECKKIINIAG